MSSHRVKELLAAHRLDEALVLANQALDENPEDDAMLFAAGQALMRADRKGLAFNLFARCLDLNPAQTAPILNAMGYCLDKEHQTDAAKALFEKSIKAKPDYALALNNLCTAYVYEGKPDKAIEYGRLALVHKPGWHDPEWNLGIAHLMRGEWREGWAGYEAGLGHACRVLRRVYTPDNGPEDWDGSPGKTVVIYGEQGIGDEVMFASAVPDAIKVCKRVILDCDIRLVGLYKRSFPDAIVYGTRYDKELSWPLTDNHNIDARCAIGSLGYLFRRDGVFPSQPYLVADPERRVQWRALLDSLPGKLKVGIAWKAGVPQTFNKRRSLAPEELMPILKTPGVDWISLEYKDPSEDLAEFAKHGVRIHHWRRCTEAADYDETAALVAELDLIVCPTTSVVHLAAALGKKCHVLVPEKSTWRYMAEGAVMPIHPIHALHRQVNGKWTVPVNQIAKIVRLNANIASGSR